MPSLIAIILALCLSGCANLIIRDEDSIPVMTGKVLTRVVLAPATVMLSEVAIGAEVARERHNAALTKSRADCHAIGKHFVYYVEGRTRPRIDQDDATAGQPFRPVGCLSREEYVTLLKVHIEAEAAEAANGPSIDPLAAYLLLGGFAQPRPTYQPGAAFRSAPTLPPAKLGTNCTSQVIGHQVFTNCY